MLLNNKKILLISSLEPWSISKDMGAPSLYETLKHYVEQGAEVHYLTNNKNILSNDAHRNEINAALPNFHTHRFPLSWQIFKALPSVQSKLNRLLVFPLCAAAKIDALIQETKPDLIYAYEQSAILAVQILRNKKKLNIPVVNRYQGTILGERYSDKALAMRKLETTLALKASADAFVMTNDGTFGDQALKYWNEAVRERNLLFIRNGIDLSIKDTLYDRSETLSTYNLSPDNVYLITVSRLAEWKRVDRAIKLLASLKEQFPKLRLLVCGDGPARAALERLAGEQGVSSQTHFLGGQPRDQIARLLQAADVFLSLYDVSNCGNPLFEALLTSKPIITLDNGTTSEVIIHGHNGLILKPDDEQALIEALRSLLLKPEFRTLLSEGAKRWADRELYDWRQRINVEIAWLKQTIPTLN